MPCGVNDPAEDMSQVPRKEGRERDRKGGRDGGKGKLALTNSLSSCEHFRFTMSSQVPQLLTTVQGLLQS